MLKKTLVAFAALAALGLGAATHSAPAEAGYGFKYHGKKFSVYVGPKCYWRTKPIVIKVWDEYSYSYVYKTIYSKYRSCY